MSQLVAYCFQCSRSHKLIWKKISFMHIGSPDDNMWNPFNPELSVYPLYVSGYMFRDGGLPLKLHLSGVSSVSGRAPFHLRSGTFLGWRSGPGWPGGSLLPALRRLRSSAALCDRRLGTAGRPASTPHGAAAISGCWRPAGTGCLHEGVAPGQSDWKLEGRGRGRGRGLAPLVLVWSGWGSHTDPS